MTYAKLLELAKADKYTDNKKIIEALEDCIRQEASKDNKTSSQLSCIKRLMAGNKKMADTAPHKKAHDFKLNGLDYIGYTDGHYVLASTNDFCYEHAEQPFEMSRFFNYDCDGEYTFNREDVKAFTKLHSKKEHTPYIVDVDGVPYGFNAWYLIDCIDFTGTATCRFAKKHNRDNTCYINPVIFEAGDNIALLLPINV